jgi:glycosyltransferase involved in cell wall biosynthesis
MFRSLGFNGPMAVIPAGTEPVDQILAPNMKGQTVGFLGSLDWLPNQQGVNWLIDEVWPRVIAQNPNARLKIAGKNPPIEWSSRQYPESVQPVGEIQDKFNFYSSLDLAVIPLLAGSGMRVKLVELLGRGLPVVSTAVGAEGVPVTHGKEVWLANRPDEMAEAILALLADPARRLQLAEAGNKFAWQNYSLSAIADRFTQFYRQLGCG